LNWPLPQKIDRQIVEITREIINHEQRNSINESLDELRHRLNELVEHSYGKPIWSTPQRTGTSPEVEAWKATQGEQTKTTIGQILDISEDANQVYIYISRLMEDDETDGIWVPLPQELPGWALDGTPFEAELSHDVKTFEQLIQRPWALRRFRHTPRPYLSDDELNDFLDVSELEVPS
jgi:hypothetical protein